MLKPSMNANAASRIPLSSRWLHARQAIMSSAFAAFGTLPMKLCLVRVGDGTSIMLVDRSNVLRPRPQRAAKAVSHKALQDALYGNPKAVKSLWRNWNHASRPKLSSKPANRSSTVPSAPTPRSTSFTSLLPQSATDSKQPTPSQPSSSSPSCLTSSLSSSSTPS